MSEIHRHAQGKAITLGIAGATGVSAKFYRNGYNPATLKWENYVVATPTVASVAAPEYWAAPVPYAITHTDGDFQIEWTYTVESNQYVKKFTHQVVTPLIPITVDTDLELEQAVRFFIQAYTNNYFGAWEGYYDVAGTGHGALALPRRLDRLVSVSNGDSTYEPAGFVIAGDGWYLERTPGTNLTIKDAPPDEYVPVFSNKLIVPPYSRYNTIFRDNEYFRINGVWGYEGVPADVSLAADLLYNDYACADAAYRNRFINSMRAGNWRFDLRDDAFAGTGNLTADRLLDAYRNDPMEIV